MEERKTPLPPVAHGKFGRVRAELRIDKHIYIYIYTLFCEGLQIIKTNLVSGGLLALDFLIDLVFLPPDTGTRGHRHPSCKNSIHGGGQGFYAYHAAVHAATENVCSNLFLLN